MNWRWWLTPGLAHETDRMRNPRRRFRARRRLGRPTMTVFGFPIIEAPYAPPGRILVMRDPVLSIRLRLVASVETIDALDRLCPIGVVESEQMEPDAIAVAKVAVRDDMGFLLVRPETHAALTEESPWRNP